VRHPVAARPDHKVVGPPTAVGVIGAGVGCARESLDLRALTLPAPTSTTVAWKRLATSPALPALGLGLDSDSDAGLGWRGAGGSICERPVSGADDRAVVGGTVIGVGLHKARSWSGRLFVHACCGRASSRWLGSRWWSAAEALPRTPRLSPRPTYHQTHQRRVLPLDRQLSHRSIRGLPMPRGPSTNGCPL
jgi:hypothetical protein